MGLYVNILMFLLFIVFTLYYVKKSFLLTFLYGLVFYQAFSILPSLIYIEQGILINEQGRFSFFTGATILATFYFIFTFLIIAMSFKTFNKKRLPVFHLAFKGENIDLKIVIFIVLIAQGVLLINAALSPLPLFDSSVSRFTYWQSSRFPFLNTLLGNTAIFIPFGLGIIFPKYKKFAVLMMLVFFVYNFLIGQKFSPIFGGSFSFLLPIVFFYRENIFQILKKNILPLLTSFLLLFGFVYYITYIKYEETRPFANIKIYEPNEAILYRIFGLQGHLMWGATDRYVVNSDYPKSFNPADLLYGMREMMDDFAYNRANVLSANTIGGYNFTNAYPGILLKTFPISIAIFVHTFLTIFFLALMGWILKELLIQRSIFFSVIAYQLFNWTVYAFIMGYFHKLYPVIFFMIFYGIFIYLRKPSNDLTSQKIKR
ncbi:MAG: DUF6418 domain-containing protein [Flavobacteriaceae bacterium]